MTQPGQSMAASGALGGLDVPQLALQDRGGELRQLERVGPAHAAAHVALGHLGEPVAGLLQQLPRRRRP